MSEGVVQLHGLKVQRDRDVTKSKARLQIRLPLESPTQVMKDFAVLQVEIQSCKELFERHPTLDAETVLKMFRSRLNTANTLINRHSRNR